MTACDCGACGLKFTSLAAFDRHQDVDYRRDPPVRCLDPETIGLDLNSRGRWHEPLTPAGRDRLEALRTAREAGVS